MILTVWFYLRFKFKLGETFLLFNEILHFIIIVYLRSNDLCNQVYQANVDEVTAKIYLPRLLIDSQFCAGSFVGEIAPGDSGGPATTRKF